MRLSDRPHAGRAGKQSLATSVPSPLSPMLCEATVFAPSRRATPSLLGCAKFAWPLRVSLFCLVALPHDFGWTPHPQAGSRAPLRDLDGRGFAPTNHRAWAP